MDSLPHLAVTHDFVNLNTNRIAVNVEHNAAPAMIEPVRHALLNGRIDHNVDVVAALELDHVPGGSRHALGPVGLGKLVPRAVAVTPRFRARVSHGLLERVC